MIKNTKVLFFCIALLSIGCGTIIGNGITDPTSPSGPSGPSSMSLNFDAPVSEYSDASMSSTNTIGSDCGYFTQDSTDEQVDAGRNCIHDAFVSCTPKRYLYDKKNSDGSRFVSFVYLSEPATPTLRCQINIHTVSNVAPANIGDVKKSCNALGQDEIPEVACGIQ